METTVKQICWHGTTHDFTEFSTEHFGERESQYGDGFYFADDKEIAMRYLEDGKGFLIKAEVTLNNPYHVNAADNANMRKVELDNREKVVALMKRHPDIYNQPDCDTSNPLGDYLGCFWAKERWSHNEFDEMIEQLVNNFFINPSWLHVENFFGKHSNAFHEAMREVYGYDGIVVDWPERDVPCGSRTLHQEAAKFFIAWFPEQIRVIQKFQDTAETEDEKPMIEPPTWSYIIKLLEQYADKKHNGYWTDGEEILCCTEEAAEHLANFLEDIGFDCVMTGSYDPAEDEAFGTVDDHTGYWYVTID